MTASDLDTGNNARITYRIVGGNQFARNSKSLNSSASIVPKSLRNVSDIFGIFPSGWIYLRDVLDREKCEMYDLKIIASDNGSPSLSAEAHVIVNVLDVNDNAPMFARDFYEFSVEENQPRSVTIGTVKATDIDAGMNAEIRYNLVTNTTLFQVNAKTGAIVAREMLDRERSPQIELTIEARDLGAPSQSSRIHVRVNILDVNDNAPEFVDPIDDVISVREGQSPGTDVSRIKAIDRDDGINATVTYSILKGRDSDGFSLFTIDATTGLIQTRVSFDREDRSIYRLAVAATDAGKPPKQTVRILRVEILDLNDNRPTFTSSNFAFKVAEDAPIGHVVGILNETRRSDGNDIVYTITTLTSDPTAHAFDIDSSTGSLVLTRNLDRETQSEYNLEIRASDRSSLGSSQSSAIAVKIEVLDVNDNKPRWSEDPIEIVVAENTAMGLPLFNFTATDVDAGENGSVHFELVDQLPLSERKTFNVNAISGVLTHSNTLDFEDVNEFILTVKAIDQAKNESQRLSSMVTARVKLIDVNDNAPKFISPSEENAIIFVSESMAIGQTVVRVFAVDKDAGNNGRIKYAIVNGNSHFAIDAANGTISLQKSFVGNHLNSAFDATVRRHSIVVSASDFGHPTPLTTKTTIQIIVQETNNNPPKFSESIYHANISENVPIGTFVAQVRAKSFQTKGSKFNLILFLKKIVYSFIFIKMSIDQKHFLFIISGGNLTYEISSHAVNDLFAIDATRGVVTTKAAIDREVRDSYTIPVYAIETSHTRNQMTKFDVAYVMVSIGDVNDHAPEFKSGTCYPLAVPENGETAVIHTVVATDRDEGMNAEIVYSIVGGNSGNKFSIDGDTGALTARSLDRETQSRYLLQISAQDRGSPSSYQGMCNISIIVEDQNDNDPRFELTKYAASIGEDAPMGTSVLRVKANDADVGVNARIVYSLINETNWTFSIDSRTGVISTTNTLDRETTKEYNFMVLATDSGQYEARSERVSVQLIVEDVNDNRPIFDEHPFRGRVAVNIQPGQTILQVTANDSDLGSNGEIVYNLLGDAASQFRLNAKSGALTAAQSLSNLNGQIVRLEMMARDKGNPPQSSTGLIELQIGEIANEAAQLSFQNESYSVNLMENAAAGHRLLHVNAVRNDGRRQMIVYNLEHGNDDDAFVIDAKNGEISVADSERLDYERRQSIRLIVGARTEGISPPIFAYCEVTVRLQDENDNAPRFTQRQYEAAVSEGIGKGTLVANVLATDVDEGANSRVLYHIVDGNHDNAFIIEPAFSGTVKTNIVLDREIRDLYRLKVISIDQGVPQMTGTSTINVHVIDVNDNRPTFPPRNSINVAEGKTDAKNDFHFSNFNFCFFLRICRHRTRQCSNDDVSERRRFISDAFLCFG